MPSLNAFLLYTAYIHSHSTSLTTDWSKSRERIDFKLAVLVYKCQHGAAPNLRSWQTSRLIGYIPPHHRSCQPSVTEPSWLPQLAFGTVCHSMSCLHHHCLSSGHIQELESKRDLRKSGPPSTSNFECQICHRMCHSRIGLLVHNKSHL